MENLGNYFNVARDTLGLPSKKALADFLGMRPQEMTRAQKEGYCSDEVIEKLAKVTKTPAVLVFTARELTKPQSESMKMVWLQIFINLADLHSRRKLYTGTGDSDLGNRKRLIGKQYDQAEKVLANQLFAEIKDYRK